MKRNGPFLPVLVVAAAAGTAILCGELLAARQPGTRPTRPADLPNPFTNNQFNDYLEAMSKFSEEYADYQEEIGANAETKREAEVAANQNEGAADGAEQSHPREIRPIIIEPNFLEPIR